jgi:kynurenine formamidase
MDIDDPVAHIWAYGETLRTWGAWGEDDEKGAANHITPERRARAATLVRRGAVFSLALPIRSGKGPMNGLAGRFNPLHHMTITGDGHGPGFDLGAEAGITDDVLLMGLQTSTQWDALCHVYYQGAIYNGFPAAGVTTAGASHGGIDNVHAELAGRGVLLDVARWQGLDELEPGYAITSEDLTACATAQDVAVEPGDILLVRTGAMTRVDGDDWSRFHAARRAGLHYTTAEWLAKHRIAGVAADNNGVEAPSPLPGVRNPLHMVALRDMGILLGEFWDLEGLAEDCSLDGIYEFLLIAQPLRIEGAAGSPINPLAIK